MDSSTELLINEIREHLKQGGTLFEQGKIERVVEILTGDLDQARKKLSPHHALYGSLVVNLADCHLQLGNYAIAEQLVQEYLEQLGEGGDEVLLDACRNLLANIYMRTLRIPQAEAMLLKSIGERSRRVGELHPSQINEHYLLILIYLASGRIEEAKALLPRMAQMRSKIPPGSDEAQELAAMVTQAFDLLGGKTDLTATDPGLVKEPAPKSDDMTFYRREAECWREFVDRKFKAAAHSALELLVERATLRLIEIRLLSLLWTGAGVEKDGERALKVAPHGSWERALVEFTLGRVSLNAALDIAKDEDDVAQCYFYAGLLALSVRHEDDAREYFRKAAEAKSEIPERAQAVRELESLDLLAREMSEFGPQEQAQIKKAYRSFALLDYRGFLTSVSPSDLQHLLTPQILMMYAVSLRALGQVEMSDDCIRHARRQLLRWPWHERLLDLLSGRTPPQAFLSEARDEVQVCQLHYYAMAQKRLAGQWEEALLHREACLKTMAKCPERELAELDGSDPAAMIDNVNDQLTVLVGHGQLAMAYQLGRAAVAAARNLPGLDPVIFADALSNLASIAGMEGKLSESLRLFDELETMASTLSLDKQFVHALNAGQIYLEHSFLEEARRFLPRAWQISQSLKIKPHDRAAMCNALGRLAADSGDLDESIRWHREAGSSLEHAGSQDALMRAIIADNIGVSLALKRCYQEALAQHEEAYETLSKATVSEGGFISDSHSSLCKILTNWAGVLTQLGQYAEAERRANEALRICELPGANMDEVKRSALSQLAMMFAASGRPSEALEKMLQASALGDRELGEIMTLGSDELRMEYAANARFELSMLLSVVGPHFSTESPRLETVFDVVLRRKALAAEAAAVRRDAVLGGRYPRLRPLLEELGSLQSQIAAYRLSLARKDIPPEMETDISSQSERARWLEAVLAKEIPELQLEIALRKVNARQLFSNLPTTWSIVEFVRSPICNLMIAGGPQDAPFSEERYWAFVIPSANLDSLALIDLGPARELDQIVTLFLTQLEDLPERRVHSMEVLREKLLDPVFSHFPDGGHILAAPEGSLAQLPFEVLTDAEGRYLIDRYSFSYLATCRDLLRLSVSSRKEPSPDVVVADPDFDYAPEVSSRPKDEDRRFPPLPGTRQEGQAIAQILGVEPWLGADARESKIMQLSSPRILHLATHGFFDQATPLQSLWSEGVWRGFRSAATRESVVNPLLRSGLAFAGANAASSKPPAQTDDGLLSAAEVTAIDLTATQLVVLSACETGLGAIHATEGVMGVRRAFQLAGARSVIASLWKVPDEETFDLMKGFYRRLVSGMPRGAALRAAQLELRQRFPPPFYWGAFVCFGEIGPVPGMERMVGYDAAGNRRFVEDARNTLKELNLLIEAGSSNSKVWLQRGICYHNLHRFEEAIADFDRAAELAPDLADVYFNRGFAWHLLKRYQEAVSDFNRALKLEADFPEAYHRRGNAFAALGDFDAALKDLTRAAELAPDDPDIFYDRAGFLANRKSFQQATADYTEAIRLRPSFQIAYVNRATVLLELGKSRDAIHDLETAIQLVPDDALAHLNLGSAYALDGDKKKALESWEEAARLGNAEVVRAARMMQAAISRS